MKNWVKLTGKERRKKIIRNKISGTSDRPRLAIFRSLNNIYVQIIDDTKGSTLVALSTISPDLRDKVKKDAGNVKGAVLLGEALAEVCKKKGITKVVFDRAGYMYHGRVKAVAEAARKNGLVF